MEVIVGLTGRIRKGAGQAGEGGGILKGLGSDYQNYKQMMNEEQEGDSFLTTLQPMNGVNQLESEKFIF